jgi:regulator of protease activity HflC (stomatin/prohibitin superfamily)
MYIVGSYNKAVGNSHIHFDRFIFEKFKFASVMVDTSSLVSGQGVKAIAVAVLVVSGFLLGSVAFSFGTVGEGDVAVETQWGEATGTVYEDGQYWEGNPLLLEGYSHGSEKLNVEPVTMRMQVDEGLSKDGQDIDATVSVTYQLDGDQAHSFYTDSEKSGAFTGGVSMWEERVGQRAVTAAVQDASASVSALEIVQEFDAEEGADVEFLRQELQSEVEQQLREENEQVSPEIEILEVRVEQVQLSSELNSGLEDIAVEQAEAERQIVDAKADARAERERAQGQADAFETKKEAYGGSDEALQAEWIEAINQDEGTIVIDAEAAPILDLNEEGNVTSTQGGE